MPTAPLTAFIQHYRWTVLAGEGAGMSDGKLLQSFLTYNDEAAFGALVKRHGPMVFGVCRRVLRNSHDAEDAFQATFCVLIRKAASIRPRERVGSWLHGVAYRTALKARAVAARRTAREKQMADVPEPEAVQQNFCGDLKTILDQELGRLPEKYRLPIVLCHLEGKSIKAATQQLAWPQGTVAGRLARARSMLAKRLTRRGVVLSASSLALVFTENAWAAPVPVALAVSTVRNAALLAAGSWASAGVVSAQVAALTKGVLKNMLISKLKVVAALLALTVAVGGGSVRMVQQSWAAGQGQLAIGLVPPPINFDQENKPDPVLQSADKAKSAADLVWRKLGIMVVHMDAEVVKAVNRDLRGGLRISKVNPDGVAASVGIKEGDILVGLNQWETVKIGDVAYVLTDCDPKTLLSLKYYIIRDGKVCPLQLSLAPDQGPAANDLAPASENAAAKKASRVAAWVNGKPIFEDEVFNVLGPQLRRILADTPPTQRESGTQSAFKKTLDLLIDNELLKQDAFKMLEANPKLLEKMKEISNKQCQKQIKARMQQLDIATMDEFKQVLLAQGTTLETYRRMMEREEIASQYLHSQIKEKVDKGVTEELMQEYYNQHLNEFLQVDRVKWQGLFIAVGPKHPTLVDARRFAEQVLKRWAAGEDIAKLLEFDDGDSQFRKGDGAGELRGDIKPRELEPCLFALKDGEFGPPLELTTGVHIYRVVKRDSAGVMPFEGKAQNMIKNKFTNEMFDVERKQLVRQLRERALIEIEKWPSS